MNELIEMVVREYTDDPPRELRDYTKELCDACYNYASRRASLVRN